MRAYHILPSDHALTDIALQRLKVATFSDLNDPFELLAVSLGFDPLREAFTNMKRDLAKTKGLLCFSKKWENSVLWSHYGAGHTGICLGFDINDASIEEVEYVGQRLPVPVANDKVVQFDETFMRRLLITKYEHWSYEEEVRVFIQLDPDSAERGLYFQYFSKDLKLREVILGPLCEVPPTTVYSLTSSIYDGVDVIKAELAYKWYKVVPGKTYKSDE